MNGQLTLATVEKAKGQAKALANESEQWLILANAAMRRRAGSFEPFTAEHIREDAGNPWSPGSLGSLFSLHRGHGCIRQKGFVSSTRRQAHGRWFRSWVGTGKRCPL